MDFKRITLKGLGWKLFLLVYMVTPAITDQCEPPRCHVVDGVETLCAACPVGQGVVVNDQKELLHCKHNSQQNTQCERCQDGIKYSDEDSYSKCKRCTSCNEDSQVETISCTAEHDYQCECKSEHYYDDINAKACINCTPPCNENEVQVLNCTPTQDRTCGPKPPTPPTTKTMTTNETSTKGETTDFPSVMPPTQLPSTSRTSNNNVIIIACVIPFIIFVIIVIVWVMCKYNPERRPSVCSGNNGPPTDTERQLSSAPERQLSAPVVNCCSFICLQNNHQPANEPPVGYTVVAEDIDAHGTISTNGRPNGLPNGQPNGIPNGQHNCHLNGLPNGNAELSVGEEERNELLETNPESPAQGELARPPPEQPTAPLQELLFREEEESYITLHLEVSDALRMAGEKLGISEHDLGIWEEHGSAINYLIEKWQEKDRTRADFVAALREIGRDVIAAHLSNGDGD